MIKFCDPKTKILLKEVNNLVFGEDETIKVNFEFTSNTNQSNLIPQKIIESTAEETYVAE